MTDVSPDTTDVKAVAREFAHALSENGHGFHYAVVDLARQLAAEGRSQWSFEVSEFPVATATQTTRIDFILRHKHHSLAMVAECKRANPSHGDWCFIRAPYTRHGRPFDVISVERVTYYKRDGGGFANLAGAIVPGRITGYNVALPVKANRPGDSGGSPRKMIEEAATQVSIGVNGLVRTLAANKGPLIGGPVGPNTWADAWCVDIVAVLFTTAHLWTTSTELSATDLATGNITADQLPMAEEPYVAYQYHVSPDIRHGVNTNKRYTSLGELLDGEFMRTIFVVSVVGIEKFLTRDWY